MKLSKPLKRNLIASFSLLYLAGTTYWISRVFLKKKGEFGPEPHPLESIAGPIHVVAAFLFLFVCGIVWAHHVGFALKLKRQRPSGWAFYIALAGLIATGVTILYSPDSVMKTAEQIHPWLGQALLPLLLWHGLRKRAKLQT